MNKLISVVATVLLAAAGWWFYTQQNAVPAPDAAAEDATDISVSFMCEDGSHFVAEFPDTMSDLHVVVDGVLMRELLHVQGDGQRFEDDAYAYVFAGEEANVTDKASGATTVCNQPFDANSAPFNFGDAGEGGGIKQDVTLIVSESIIGKWQDVSDGKFVREFKAGGMATDWYDSKTVSEGSWSVFTKENAPEAAFPLEESMAYIRMTMQGTQDNALTFKVAKLTPEELELMYMERGGVLRFKSVQ